MEVNKKIKIENITIKLDENEAFYLKDLLLFAFDYECEHPNSLYRSEKELAKELIDKLSLDSQSAKAEEINHKSFQEMSNEELKEYYNKFIKDNPKCHKIFTDKIIVSSEEDREIDLRGMYIDKNGKLHNDYDEEEKESEGKSDGKK